MTVNGLLLLCLLLLQHLECDCRKQELSNSLVTPVETLWERSGKMIRNKERKTEKAAEMAKLQKYRVEVAVHRLNRQSISTSKPLWSSAIPESLLKSQISGSTVRIQSSKLMLDLESESLHGPSQMRMVPRPHFENPAIEMTMREQQYRCQKIIVCKYKAFSLLLCCNSSYDLRRKTVIPRS